MEGFFAPDDRLVLLAHGRFPDHAKTAVGVLRYGEADVVAVLDRERAGTRVADHAPGLPDAPVVASVDEVAGDADALVVGIAPSGGAFEAAWRPDVRTALEAGWDVVAGLHDSLAEDSEFAALADSHGGSIHDVREPPADLPLGTGAAADADAHVVLTVGTDASVGKMTTAVELVRAARERGVDAALVPTGQTGILVAGWGVAIDRVPADFVSGVVEQMVLERAPDHDLLVVEGQGSIGHPAYSADAVGILHGAGADDLVLVHDPVRETLTGFDAFPVPDPATSVDLYESVAAPVHPSKVAAGALDTSVAPSDATARDWLDEYESALGEPATDPVRFGADVLLEHLGAGSA